MEWDMGLSAGPGGFGVAISLAEGQTHLLGMFPTIARCVTSAFNAAPSHQPRRVVLVHPTGISVRELGRYVGDLAAAGLDPEAVEMRSDIDVLESSITSRALLIDADRDLLIGRLLRTALFDADTLARHVADDPVHTRVFLTGHPEVRDRYHLAARDYAPQIVERPALAALALNTPTPTSLMSTTRLGSSLMVGPRRAWPLLITMAIAVSIVVGWTVLFLT